VIATRKHLDYALGYIELGLLDEAREELARIPADEHQTSPVLAVQLELSMADENWDGVVTLAPQVVLGDETAERPWIAWAYALREHQRITEARDVLLRGALVISQPSGLVDYNLACYYCLLGDLDEARRRLKRACSRKPHWKKDSLTDPDLAALHAPRKN
jgi:Flp pilus assembly protein TadD